MSKIKAKQINFPRSLFNELREEQQELEEKYPDSEQYKDLTKYIIHVLKSREIKK